MSLRSPSCRPTVLPLAGACLLLAGQAAVAQTVPSDHALQLAQAAAPDLPNVVVTANRVAQPLTDVLADVTLIDEAQIQRSGAVNIADLLQRQPGLELSRNGGPGTTTSLFMRGAENRFTAVYVDGVRVDTQSTGGAPWEAISLGQVERIEIVRGPAAAVYGSDAIAGVVQIFTRKGDGPFSPYVGAGIGSHGTRKLEAGFSGKSGAVDYALGAARDISRGYDSRPGTNPDRDGYGNSSFSGRVGLQLNSAHRLEASGTYTDMKSQYDGFTPNQDDRGHHRLGTLGVAWAAQWSPQYSTRLSVNESRQRYDTAPDLYRTETTLRNYLLQNEWRSGGHLVTAALERREDHLDNPALNPWDRAINQRRHQDGIALGYGYTAGAHTLQINARHDRDSEFGGQGTGSVAYGYSFAPGWRVTAAAGTAFRVPTLYQRFSEYGQPALQPEKARNVELGLHWSQGASRFGVTAYRNKVRDLITFGAAGACGSAFGCYENTGRALLQGVTLSGAHRLAGVNLAASLDLQNPRDDVSGTLLARRAKRVLKLNADTRVGDWTLGAEWLASSQRYDNAANTRVLAGYGLVNLYASTTIAREWAVLARIDNLGDRDYQVARGYATGGRTLYVGVRWTPKN
ncbi:TonB-dependent receptor [Ottowia sp.]|uniref:TonB-dependent receptor domain-containing protein n=1 Tax=Ottowia sp. TaxID=1898956 RepID=UPI002CFA8427|nr:TonB-dependent receptor [Ottowia sp.]HOB67243.1 TonB-dependent receptor [Ottowia sp.]HPZ56533.1 TonB-dependent receptor [Ottowia sp.]HQD47663.1 TonB-dependent receptor [Ottowia sp.]